MLDIEGTTTPVEFVYEVLFPYAGDRVEEFVRRRGNAAGVREDVQRLRLEHAEDAEKGLNPPPWNDSSGDSGAELAEALALKAGAVASYARWLIDSDRKSTPLKSLQGKIWEDGYRSGELEGQVYPDVRPAFERWTRQGRKIFIFSSGSVLAQKLLFGNSTDGNLSELIDGYFDTTTGPKKEEASYRRIAAEVGLQPEEIWFASDVVDELDAARGAGMLTALCVRAEGSVPETSEHPVIRTFEEVFG